MRRAAAIARRAYRRSLGIGLALLLVGTFVPLGSIAQAANAPTLSPEAQAAVDKGVLAAKEKEWDIAIRSFQDARKIAPDAPEIYYDLGLAESKVPGRELRAMIWLGAYLTLAPRAANSAEVKQFILQLQVKQEANVAHLLKTLQVVAGQLPPPHDQALRSVASLWVYSGDDDAARAVVQPISLSSATWADAVDQRLKERAAGGDFSGAERDLAALSDADRSTGERFLAEGEVAYVQAQAQAGMFDSAMALAGRVSSPAGQAKAFGSIAQAEAAAGLVPSALASATRAEEAVARASGGGDLYSLGAAYVQIGAAYMQIVEAQLGAGDFAGAEATAHQMSDDAAWSDYSRSVAEWHIATTLASAGDTTGALSAAQLIVGSNNHNIYKSAALTDIAQAQASVGDIQGAQSTMQLAKQISDPPNANGKTYDADDDAEGYAAIAGAQLKANDIAGARATLALALDEVPHSSSGISAPFYAAEQAKAIVRAQVGAGDLAGARQTADQAVHAAELSKYYQALAEAAEAQADAGEYVKAGVVASEVSDASYRAWATAYVKAVAGDAPGALLAERGDSALPGVLAEAGHLDAAQKVIAAMTVPGLAAAAEAELARSLAGAGDQTDARAALLAAQRATATSDDTRALIASAAADLSDFDSAMAEAKTVEVPKTRSQVQAYVALAECKAGNIAAARAATQQIDDATVRDRAEADLAGCEAKSGDLSGAMASLSMISDAGFRQNAVVAIASARQKKGLSGPVTAYARALASTKAIVPVADWTREADKLNEQLYLDLPGYLAALPSSTSNDSFDALEKAAEQLTRANGEVMIMLKRTLGE